MAAALVSTQPRSLATTSTASDAIWPARPFQRPQTEDGALKITRSQVRRSCATIACHSGGSQNLGGVARRPYRRQHERAFERASRRVKRAAYGRPCPSRTSRRPKRWVARIPIAARGRRAMQIGVDHGDAKIEQARRHAASADSDGGLGKPRFGCADRLRRLHRAGGASAADLLQQRCGGLREGGRRPVDHGIAGARIERAIQSGEDRRRGYRGLWESDETLSRAPFVPARARRTAPSATPREDQASIPAGISRTKNESAFRRTRRAWYRRMRKDLRVGILDHALILRLTQALNESFGTSCASIARWIAAPAISRARGSGCPPASGLRKAPRKRANRARATTTSLEIEPASLLTSVEILSCDRASAAASPPSWDGAGHIVEIGFLRNQCALLRAQLHDQRRRQNLVRHRPCHRLLPATARGRWSPASLQDLLSKARAGC